MARAVLVFRDAAVEKERLEAESADAQKAAGSGAPAQRSGEGRRRGAGEARRGCARRRARAACRGRAQLPDHRGIRRRIQESAERLQRGHWPVAGDHRFDRNLDPRGVERGRRDFVEHDRPVAANGGAGRKPGRDLGVDGADLRNGEAERGERPASQPVRDRHPRGRGSRRRGGGGSGQGDVADRGILAQDLRHHRRDRRDRAPDQPAGAERGGGSRTRRRGGPRLCGGRVGGAQPGAALLAGGQGHQGSDQSTAPVRCRRASNWSTVPAPR